MGRSKNRKKRRLGRIQKLAINTEPFFRFCRFWGKLRWKRRVEIWCGLDKWDKAVRDKWHSLFTEEDWKEEEMEWDEEVGCFVEPYKTIEGSNRRFHLKIIIMETLDDSQIKGKRYHSKRATRIRNRLKQKTIRLFKSCLRKDSLERYEKEKEAYLNDLIR